MEDLIRKRKPLRMTFTKTVGSLFDELGKQTPDHKNYEVLWMTLDRVFTKMKEFDELILNEIKQDLEFEEEYTKIEEYDQKMDLARAESKIYLSNQMVPIGAAGSVISSPNTKRRMRLPKIELLQFGGDLKDYLGFWSQFQRIHNDSELAAEDKFQYLLQCVVHGSRAREVIESFPPTAENYEKAIAALKGRFGREELLIEYYVRELLSLVVKNATEKRGNLNIAKLYDKLESHLRSLESLSLTSEKYEAILFPLVESCIPEDLMRVWLRNPIQSCEENESTGSYGNKLKNLLSFLKREVEGEERLQLARNGFDGARERWKPKKVIEEVVPTASTLVSSDISKRHPSCVFCDKSHEGRDCFLAQSWSLDKKKEILSQKKACYICFKANHRSKECKSKLKCMLCSKRHHTIMCFELPVNKREVEVNGKIDTSNVLVAKESNEVLLQTILVTIEANGRRKQVRALIDSGSQNSYLLKRTVAEMGLKPTARRSLAQSLFGGVRTQMKDHGLYKITLRPPHGKFALDIQVMDQQAICGTIPRLKRGPWNEELSKKKIWIADYGEGSPDIELLIGADFCGQLFTGSIEPLQCGLIAYETHLGWCLMGKLLANDVEESSAMLVTTLFLKEASISEMWDLDVIGISDPATNKSKEEREFLTRENFLNTVIVNEEGRYEVSLPWSEDHLPLPSNKNLALKRLECTTRKLDSEGSFSLYDEAFKEWLALSIIEEVPFDQNVEAEHYLPHRPVFKENSTTKVRPVFDASAREKLSPSLNQCLESGKNLMNLIPALLLKFRELKYGVVADIEKAFLMISINPLERNMLRFLWWNEKRELKIFRHARVVFGVKCSPFLLASVIEFHLLKLSKESTYDKQILTKLLKSFYVDNVLASFSNRNDLIEFMQVSKEVMELGKFNLRGWEYTEDGTYPTTTSVLGLQWDRAKDTLAINLDWLENLEFKNITRRTILSVAHKAFDPIGLVSPVFLLPKLLLQKLWKKGVTWDMEVDDSSKTEFLSWYNELAFLKEISIPRWFSYTKDRELSVHTFCDASLQAYAATVFARVQTPNGVQVHLLATKSRVTPVKNVTIPRLELIAATVGARLCTSVLNGLDWENVQLYFWSDSTTVLSWIQRDEIWSTFVNNRVQEIRELTEPKAWRHVPGCLNPADLPSRGCSGKQLLLSNWWEGPPWLKGPKEGWPVSKVKTDEYEVARERKRPVAAINLSTYETAWYLRRFSKYSTIVRLVAWVLRFGTNCRNPVSRRAGELTVDELYLAERNLLKIVQQESFSDNVIKNKLKSLNAFRDAEGLIRVKTKIFRRKDEENFKCPIVLPSDHPLVEKLIYEQHLISCHSGTQVVLSELRQKFWILRGRKTVQRILKQCIRCKRYTSKKLETVPAPLPEERVGDALVFEVTGVDLAGPLHLKKGEKTWILLFTCAVYRAIHLELIQSLSTEGFLLGLRRFISRRGRPRKIYSDNGTNFVGAVNLLASLDWNKIVQESSILRIQWVFSPPTAAWWGGFWERMVQMVKKILRRVLGRASINFEELNTILCDAEAVINSRPLNYLSEDPEDLTPLTPAMFLQDIQTVGVPDLDNLDKVNLSKRCRYQQRLRSDLRKRFRDEYLSMLVHQQANKANIRPIQIGDVVLIGCDKKRLDWPMGRVVELFPGKDNAVRVVKVKTGRGELVRPVQRLYPLELGCNGEIFDSAAFEHLKVKNFKDKSKLDKHEGETESDKIRVDVQCTDVMKTKCGRIVRKPDRYN